MSSTFTDDSIEPDDNFVNPNINFKNRRNHVIKAEDRPEVQHYSQLSYLDKEKVMLAYREGLIKFMKIWQIKDFITIKAKVRVSMKLCYELRRIDMKENLQWYIQFAKDSYMYIGAYRKAIDEIEMYKEELWKIILYTPKGEISVGEKTNAFRELHAQTRTGVILLKELPFLTQLSKYYDLSKIDPDNTGIARLGYNKSSRNDQGLPQLGTNLYDGRTKEGSTNPAMIMTSIEHVRDKLRTNSLPENMEEDVLMQIPEYKQKKKEEQAEKRYIEVQLQKIEKEVQDIMNMDEQDENKKISKLEEVKKKYQQTVADLNDIVTPQHRQTITLLKGLEDDDDETEPQS